MPARQNSRGPRRRRRGRRARRGRWGSRDRPSVELSSDSSPFDGAHQSPSRYASTSSKRSNKARTRFLLPPCWCANSQVARLHIAPLGSARADRQARPPVDGQRGGDLREPPILRAPRLASRLRTEGVPLPPAWPPTQHCSSASNRSPELWRRWRRERRPRGRRRAPLLGAKRRRAPRLARRLVEGEAPRRRTREAHVPLRSSSMAGRPSSIAKSSSSDIASSMAPRFRRTRHLATQMPPVLEVAVGTQTTVARRHRRRQLRVRGQRPAAVRAGDEPQPPQRGARQRAAGWRFRREVARP